MVSSGPPGATVRKGREPDVILHVNERWQWVVSRISRATAMEHESHATGSSGAPSRPLALRRSAFLNPAGKNHLVEYAGHLGGRFHSEFRMSGFFAREALHPQW